MSEQLRIRTLGGLQITRGDGPVSGTVTDIGRALLVYLACTGHSYSREVLATLFWPDHTEAQALANLRRELFHLSTTFDPVVCKDRRMVRINPDADWWLDVAALEKCFAGTPVEVARIEQLERAAAIYDGEFLAGFHSQSNAFEDWARIERDRLQHQIITILTRLVMIHTDQSEYTLALDYGNRILQIDPLHEQTHEQIMRLLARSGQRTAALAQFETCRRLLADELDVEPAETLVQTYEQIRDGHIRFEAASPRANVAFANAILLHTIDNLPARSRPPAQLIGRAELLTEVETRLAEGQRLLLQGFAGTGKSALAATIVSRHLAATQGAAVWIQTGDEGPDTVLSALVHALGGTWQSGQDEGGQLQNISNLLDEHGVRFVVLDDVWNSATLERMLNAMPGRVSLLVTSRNRFPVITLVHVPVLSRAASVDLLSHHARADLQQDPDATALCSVLGDLPFAVRIAGEMLALDAMSPAELLEILADEPHVLRMPAGFEALRSDVGTLLQASLEVLSDNARDVFMAFGALYIPEATANLLVHVTRQDKDTLRSNMRDLYRRGLIERLAAPQGTAARYGIHDLAYSYARAHHQFNRHVVIQGCLDYASEHAGDLGALDLEIGNLLGAALQAHRTGADAALVALMHTLVVETQYFEARGYGLHLIGLLESAAAAAEQLGEIETAHHLYGKLGNAWSIHLGQFPPALTAYTKALELARLLDDHTREAIVLTMLGTTLFRQGEDDPDRYYAQAYALAAAHDDANALAFLLSHRSYYESQKTPPDYERSRQYSDESVTLAKRFCMDQTLWAALVSRASAERDLGLFESALKTNQEACCLACERNNRVWEAGALCGMGEVYHAMQDRDQAQHYFDQALALYRQTEQLSRMNRLLKLMQDEEYAISED